MPDNNIFVKFAGFMDQNLMVIQYGVYTVAGIGLGIALKSVKPFNKFCKPSDIPKSFIEKRMKFNGKVASITGGTDPIIFIDHYPIISLPMMSQKSKGLPVQISSLEITQNGSTWLQSILTGCEVSFVPLRTDNNVAQCILYRRKQDVGQHLVSIGFATVSGWDFNQNKDTTYAKYYKSLLGAQKKAESNKSGIWLDEKPNIISNLFYKIRRIVFSFS